MQTALVITVSVVGGLLILFSILALVMRLVRQQLRARIEREFRHVKRRRETVESNLFGLKSNGMRQVRGNGALLLTDDELIFLLAVPSRDYRVPLRAVTDISHPKSFLGKSKFTPLLVVAFDGPNGADAIGILVRDPEDWHQAIDEARNAAD